MKTRPTPETDAFAIKFKTPCGEKYWMPVDIARKLERELAAVTEQRDELAESLDFQFKLNRECIDQITTRTKERDEAREQRDALLKSLDVAQQVGIQLGEQRDRLAGALRIIAEGTSCRECGGEDQAFLAREALQSLFCDALQSLTPNEPISK